MIKATAAKIVAGNGHFLRLSRSHARGEAAKHRERLIVGGFAEKAPLVLRSDDGDRSVFDRVATTIVDHNAMYGAAERSLLRRTLHGPATQWKGAARGSGCLLAERVVDDYEQA
jgi:hypothetical protein